ncbi:MAG: DUF6528 family protein [Akkermansiaceae bacterium]
MTRALPTFAYLVGAWLSVSCSKPQQVEKSAQPPLILICEQASNRILLMDSKKDWAKEDAVVWSWSPAEDPSLEAAERKWFTNLDEAKPVRGGSQIVVTASSGGGAALIDFNSAQAIAKIWIGGSPHSAELLPDGRVIVGSSNGNSLSLWDTEENEIVQTLELSDAHGTEWDPTRNCLWALGGKQLLRCDYDPKSETPLSITKTINLPVTEASKLHPRHGGHDLTRIPGEDAYFVSDMDHLWRFDCSNQTFTPLPERHEMPMVKSISQLPSTGTIIVLQATTKWWATGPRTLDESTIWELPNSRIYKARWWLPET